MHPDYPVPRAPQALIPPRIRGDALFMVRVPIHLHEEAYASRDEVHDVAGDDLLTPKLHTEALAAER